MERKEAIRSAYRLTGGNNFYDGLITCTTLSGKAVCRLVWDMNKAENDAYLEKALSGIPEHFSGKLLEVPVGTGILTMPLYKILPKADITCLDYSADMMGQAQEKADRLHLKNVTFRQGDVGELPYADGVFDIVLSLNGFHAFPDKEAAYREVFRVLKPGGAAAVREAGTYNTRENQAQFSDFQSRLHSRLYQLCAGLRLCDKRRKGLRSGFLATAGHLVRYESH